MTEPSRDGRRWLTDVVFLIGVAVLSAVPYVTRLGFYSDDWSLMADQAMSPDQSWMGLYEAIESPDKGARPVFYMAVAGLYRTFGPAPAAFQIANTAVLTSIPVLLYVVLTQMGMARIVAVALPAVYILLPHYATTRFWFAASSLNLSLAIFMCGIVAALRSTRGHGLRPVAWGATSAILGSASLLVYETVLPLVLIVPLVLGRFATAARWAASARWLLGTIAVHTPVLIWKVTHSARFHEISLFDRIEWFAEFLGAQLEISFVRFGSQLPLVIARALGEQRNPTIVTLSACVGLGLFLYLRTIAPRASDAWPNRLSSIAATIALGAGAWILSLSLYFIVLGPAPGAAGIGNRLVNVASLGFAAIVVGVFGLLARAALPIRYRATAFCALIAAQGAAGCLVINTLAAYWTEAAREQDRVTSAIRRGFPQQLPEGTFIVDGVCPYVGPGIVFESSWDLRSRLAVEYLRWSKGADVVTSNMAPTAAGLYVSMYYGFVTKHYPYESLHMYDIRTGELTSVSDEVAARAYFERRHVLACGDGREGGGVSVLGLPP